MPPAPGAAPAIELTAAPGTQVDQEATWDPKVADTGPELLTMDEPVYPEESRAAREQGFVLFDLLVDATGQVTEARLTKGVSASIDQSAIAIVRTAKFNPGLKGKTPVAVWLRGFPIGYFIDD